MGSLNYNSVLSYSTVVVVWNSAESQNIPLNVEGVQLLVRRNFQNGKARPFACTSGGARTHGHQIKSLAL